MLKHSWSISIAVLTLAVFNVQSVADNRVALLVRDSNSLDADENNIKEFLIASRVSYDIVNANMIKNDTVNLSDYNALYMRTSSEPVTYNDPNVISKIQTNVANGGALVLEYYGSYLGSYLGVGVISLSYWHPVVYDAAYFIEAISPSSFFDNIDTWSPPLSPDDNDQLISKITQTNISYYHPYLTFNGNAQSLSMWNLYTTYGWQYLPTNSDYCIQHAGLCTSERSVFLSGDDISFINYGVGKIYVLRLKFMQLSPASSLIIGRAANKIRKNVISVGGQGCPYLLTGDLNFDCKVDIADLSIMARNWLVDCSVIPVNLACVQN